MVPDERRASHDPTAPRLAARPSRGLRRISMAPEHCGVRQQSGDVRPRPWRMVRRMGVSAARALSPRRRPRGTHADPDRTWRACTPRRSGDHARYAFRRHRGDAGPNRSACAIQRRTPSPAPASSAPKIATLMRPTWPSSAASAPIPPGATARCAPITARQSQNRAKPPRCCWSCCQVLGRDSSLCDAGQRRYATSRVSAATSAETASWKSRFSQSPGRTSPPWRI